MAARAAGRKIPVKQKRLYSGLYRRGWMDRGKRRKRASEKEDGGGMFPTNPNGIRNALVLGTNPRTQVWQSIPITR